MRSTSGLIALCLLASTPACAEGFQMAARAPAGDLAACMYRALRTENPGQMRLTSLGAGSSQELTREVSGVGSSVFMWRAEIRPSGRSVSVLSVEITRPIFGPDQYEQEVRSAVQRCAGA